MSEKQASESLTTLRLVASCPDRVGILAEVAGHIAKRGASIIEADQYEDHSCGIFFMRYVFNLPAAGGTEAEFRDGFSPIAEKLQMQWQLTAAARRKRVVVLVSKIDHCLASLLHRWKVGDLYCEIPCVISNHEVMREMVGWYKIPYHHVPVPREAAGKEAAFRETARLIEAASPDVIVLARYMQIFPEWLCETYRHRVINIHHSFLPSFVGARPYHQAVERGVKLIGATCHYVTGELDAGPIIEQDVVRVRHSDSIEELVRRGKDVENLVLARGLRYHLEDRAIVHENKTILFE
jgi:formyltetrahydrofolate deformylase